MTWPCGCEPEWALHDEDWVPVPFVEFEQHGSLDAGDERFSVRYYPQGLVHDHIVTEYPDLEGGYVLWQVMVGRWMADNAISVPCEWVIYDSEGECVAEGRVS